MDLTLSVGRQVVFSGETVVLSCTATGIPAPALTWTFNRTETEVRGGEFTVRNAISTDSGNYTCTATNSIGKTERTIRVWVVVTPQLEPEYPLKAGGSLELPCVPRSPEVAAGWRGPTGEPVESGGRLGVSGKGGLVVSGMQEELAGNYSCRVQLLGGGLRVATTRLTLMPDILTVDTASREVRLAEGEQLALRCSVLHGVNAKRLWSKDGNIILHGEGFEWSGQGELLSLAAARLGDTGNYSCDASTSYGRDSIQYRVVVTRHRLGCSARPAPDIQAVTPTSNSSVRLTWEVDMFNKVLSLTVTK